MSDSTLKRWLTQNTADTRQPAGPAGRTYAAPFARVWDLMRAESRTRRGWTLVHADEEIGILTVTCRSALFRFVDDLTVWVSLDENGLTRLEARSTSRVGRGDLGANRRRIEGLLRRLDRALGPGAKVRAAGRREH